MSAFQWTLSNAQFLKRGKQVLLDKKQVISTRNIVDSTSPYHTFVCYDNKLQRGDWNQFLRKWILWNTLMFAP